MTKKQVLGLVLALALPLLLVVSCSDNTPSGSQANTPLTNAIFTASADSDTPLQFMAEVQTTDQNQRRLTFKGIPEAVIALQNCQITRLENDNESPIPFESVGPGDNVIVNGMKHQDGNIYANRLRVCIGDCDAACYDVAVRDTIISIDYAAGSFTIATRAETISIDENTVIWGTAARWIGPECWSQNRNRVNLAAGDGDGWKYKQSETTLEFTDLAEGDIVEVRANIIDEANLLALKIKLANCTDVTKKCVEFTDYLASIDLDTRIVTFQSAQWSGVVCNNAHLSDIDGNPIALDYFSVGDYVFVKGFPLEDEENVLRICVMSTVAP